MTCCTSINSACYKLHYDCLVNRLQISTRQINKVNELGLTPINIILMEHLPKFPKYKINMIDQMSSIFIDSLNNITLLDYKTTIYMFYGSDIYRFLILLLENGANPNIPLSNYKNYKNYTPLLILTDLYEKNNVVMLEIIKMFIKFKADINIGIKVNMSIIVSPIYTLSNTIDYNTKYIHDKTKIVYTPLISLILKNRKLTNFDNQKHILKYLINNGAIFDDKIKTTFEGLFLDYKKFMKPISTTEDGSSYRTGLCLYTEKDKKIVKFVIRTIQIKTNTFLLLKKWDKEKMPLEILTLDHFNDLPINYCIKEYQKKYIT
jgi:hypothetical protein